MALCHAFALMPHPEGLSVVCTCLGLESTCSSVHSEQYLLFCVCAGD